MANDNYKVLLDRIIKFNSDRDWEQFHSEENLAKSISIEAGELLECFQWGQDYNLEDVSDEMADVLIYLIDLAYKLNLDLFEIVNKKIDKNEKKYPIDKAKGNAKKYTSF